MSVAKKPKRRKRQPRMKIVTIPAWQLDVPKEKNTLVMVKYPAPSGVVGRPSRRPHLLGIV